MVKKFMGLSFRGILAVSLALVLTAQLLADAGQYMSYRISCDRTAIWSAEDFELHSLQKSDDFYTATDSDSHLVMVVDDVMGGMEFEMDSSMPAGEVLVYYTTEAGQDYTENQRVWAVPVEKDNVLYSVSLPVQYVHTLRIDPTIHGGNRLHFGTFRLNPQRSFSDFTDFSAVGMAPLAVYTAFLAAFLKLVQEIFTKKRDKVYKN